MHIFASPAPGSVLADQPLAVCTFKDSMAAIYESVMNMNETNGKHAQWCLRVLNPQLQSYTFQARGQSVDAKSFTCILVGDNPSEYLLGCVPFEFRSPQGPEQAMTRFVENTVWVVSKPGFDMRAKTEFNGSPMKLTLLLRDPTMVRAVPPTDSAAYSFPATHIIPPATLACIVALKSIKASAPGNASKKSSGRAVDVVAKVLEMSEDRNRVASGVQTKVRDIVLADDSQTQGSNTKCSLSAWGASCALFASVVPGDGITLLGCTASLDDRGHIRINMNSRNARLIRGGSRADQLTAWNCDAEACETVTSPWQSRERIQVDGLAVFTCASAMAQLQKGPPDRTLHESVFQANRGLFSASTATSELHTQNGERLFLQAVFRDWSDRVDVFVIESAVPSIYGLQTRDEVEEKAAAGTLEVVKHRLNVRGVLRVEDAQVKYFVAETYPWDNLARISKSAARLALGFCSIHENIVVASSLAAIAKCPLLGLAIQCGNVGKIGAHRVIMLVEGTQKSVVHTLPGAGGLSAFFVESKRVKCLLGATDTFADIRGYCDLQTMLQYRLDTEKGLVMISHFTQQAPDATPILTVDYMQKVSESHVTNMIACLREEAALLMLNMEPSESKPPSSLCSPQDSKKARTLQREPTTPSR